MLPPDTLFYLVSALAVTLLGLSKGGFVGVGAISLPLMALVSDPVAAAAILLPILMVQDVVGVWAFRRSWDRHVLTVMLGALSILFGVYRLWVGRVGAVTASARSPDWVGSLFGVATGFTSQIAHAGGPPYQMWVMPRRLSRDSFVGTTAIFFAVTNWMKVPAYMALGQFTAANLRITAWLLPVAIISTFAGVRLVRAVSAERFYTIIYMLMILVGIKLIADAL